MGCIAARWSDEEPELLFIRKKRLLAALPPFMDERQANALLQALKSTAAFLGKESEYQTFVEFIKWSEKAVPEPSGEQISANTPLWIQLLSPPLRKLYVAGYDSSYEDAISGKI